MISFDRHLNWKKWVFGVRWMWQRNIRFVVLEIGPIGLVWEFELTRDYEEHPHE